MVGQYGGRVVLSIHPRHLHPGQVCEGHIETTNDLYILNEMGGLDTSSRWRSTLLDHRVKL